MIPRRLQYLQTLEKYMSITMFKATVPPLIHALNNLVHILEKGAAHAREKEIDPDVLVNYRLAPDMFPLSRQVQIATDVAKGAARLADVEPPKFVDNETTLAQLVARTKKTIKFLNQLKPAQVDGSERKTITLVFPSMTLSFEGLTYLQGFVLPNVYFHVTTTYAILRHCGVDIGKRDFLGPIPQAGAAKAAKKTAKKAAKKKTAKKSKKKK